MRLCFKGKRTLVGTYWHGWYVGDAPHGTWWDATVNRQGWTSGRALLRRGDPKRIITYETVVIRHGSTVDSARLSVTYETENVSRETS